MGKGSKKCFANCHMSPEEYGFWDICRQLSYKFKGKLIFDGRTIAEYFNGTGKNTAYRLANRLRTLGWFVCTKESKRGKDGLWVSTEYRVLSHEEWVKMNDAKHCKTPVPETGMEQSEAGSIQSQNREQSSPGTGNSPVPEPGHSIEYSPISSKKRFEKLRPAWQAPLEIEHLNEAERGLGKAENVPPVPKSGQADPFPGMSAGMLVTQMLPHKRGMELYAKYKQGTEYEKNRADIVAEVLDYRMTQEVPEVGE